MCICYRIRYSLFINYVTIFFILSLFFGKSAGEKIDVNSSKFLGQQGRYLCLPQLFENIQLMKALQKCLHMLVGDL